MQHLQWVKEAVIKIEADFNRSSDTHLIKLNLPFTPTIHFYLKDESTHPTGSLKHRLARSLFLYGFCNGWIGKDTTVIETSSGSTAVSEAYFAQLLGLRFIAVMPRSTSKEKSKKIEFYGGVCHLVDKREIGTSHALFALVPLAAFTAVRCGSTCRRPLLSAVQGAQGAPATSRSPTPTLRCPGSGTSSSVGDGSVDPTEPRRPGTRDVSIATPIQGTGGPRA